jgi:hypothetical protein
MNSLLNPLLEFATSGSHRSLHKWVFYLDIYHGHFERFRNTNVVVVEVGVEHGGSLQMWKNYFGPDSRIIGVDINPLCKELEESQIEVIIGDQANEEFWLSFKEQVPHVDILIDDGGHTMLQQKVTFDFMYSHVSENGIYLCEDMHTSYLSAYQNPGTITFVERSKMLIDELNGRVNAQGTPFTFCTLSMHFYPNMLFLEKGILTDFRSEIFSPTVKT